MSIPPPRAVLMIASILLLGLAACRKDAPEASPAAATSSAQSTQVAGPPRFAASMITIAHAEVKEYSSRKPKPTRTPAEALAIARGVAEETRRDPSRFGAVAEDRSEDPFAPKGGALGTWKQGENTDVEAAIAGLAVGQISDPIASDYGYRVFLREAPLAEERVSARHLVVAYAGATRSPAGLARTKDEALARAAAIAAKAKADPAGFEALIKAESDGWDRDRGGALGVWTLSGGRYPAAFDRAVAALKPGEISGPVTSEFGYQIFQRATPVEAPAQIAGAHILIAWKGAAKARADVTRTQAEAEAEAKRILEEVKRDPSRFGLIAKASSDDATAARGGDLGSFRRGEMPPAFDEAMAALPLGEVGGPVLTQYGYHIILRREAPTDKDYVVR